MDLIERQAARQALTNVRLRRMEKKEPVDAVWECADAILQLPSAQPERLTDDDFETIRIHLSAIKERLCNQHRWEEAQDYQRLIDRFVAFAEQPEQRWILCSERLPDEQGRYLVSDGLEIWMCDFVNIFVYRGWANEAAMPVVKAWMPLPEPWKGESDGKDTRSDIG